MQVLIIVHLNTSTYDQCVCTRPRMRARACVCVRCSPSAEHRFNPYVNHCSAHLIITHMSSVGMSIHGSSESSIVTLTILLAYPCQRYSDNLWSTTDCQPCILYSTPVRVSLTARDTLTPMATRDMVCLHWTSLNHYTYHAGM